MTTKEDILNGITDIQIKREKEVTNTNCNNMYCSNSYCDYCVNCLDCTRCSYLVGCNNCTDCKDCFLCTDLKDCQYMIENVQLTKEEYCKFFDTLKINKQYKAQWKALDSVCTSTKVGCFDLISYSTPFGERYLTTEHINRLREDKILSKIKFIAGSLLVLASFLCYIFN